MAPHSSPEKKRIMCVADRAPAPLSRPGAWPTLLRRFDMGKDTTPGWRCRSCQQLLPPEAFYPSTKQRRMWTCIACQRLTDERRYLRNRAFIDALKLERGCTDCGYRDQAVALEFDHLPGFKKRFKISEMLASYRLELIKAEIDKCEVVCANCHAVRTMKRGHARDYYAALRESRPLPKALDDPQRFFYLADEPWR